MNIWPRFLRFLWEEEATPASSPTQAASGLSPPEEGRSRQEATGVPALLQKATRWSVMAVVGAALMGQIIGVRLIAPVDAADETYKRCTQTCASNKNACADGLATAAKECWPGNTACVPNDPTHPCPNNNANRQILKAFCASLQSGCCECCGVGANCKT